MGFYAAQGGDLAGSFRVYRFLLPVMAALAGAAMVWIVQIRAIRQQIAFVAVAAVAAFVWTDFIMTDGHLTADLVAGVAR